MPLGVAALEYSLQTGIIFRINGCQQVPQIAERFLQTINRRQTIWSSAYPYPKYRGSGLTIHLYTQMNFGF